MLAHDTISADSSDAPKTVVFLHGILGSRNNWRSFANKLVDACRVRAVVVDLRNHGDSHGFSPPHSLQACGDDVRSLLHAVGGDVVVGHSFGGKVALMVADACEQTWVLDAPPGVRVFTGASDLERVIDVVGSVPMPVASRRALVATLLARGLSEPLAQWMTTNLKEGPGADGFVWRFDLPAIPEMLASFASTDLWPVVEQYGSRVHLVRAARSDRFSGEELARFERAPNHHVLADAGHWLHTDNPAGLLAIIRDHLPSSTTQTARASS